MDTGFHFTFEAAEAGRAQRTDDDWSDEHTDDDRSDGGDTQLTARSNGAWDRIATIKDQLQNNDPGLTELVIGHRDYVPTDLWSPHEWERGGEMIGRNSQLQDLNFCGTLNDGTPRNCLELFIRGIARNRSVQNLALYERSFLGGKIFDMLASFFQNNASLQSLSIDPDDTWLPESKAFRSLLAALPKFCCLKAFCLRNTDIGDEGIVEIIQALSGHSQLERFDIRNNDIRGGLADFVDATTEGNYSMLKDLILSNNPQVVSAEYLPTLCNLLRCPTSTIESLFLSGNAITNDVLHDLVEALADNSRLKGLSLDMNHSVTPSGWQELAALLRNQQCSLEEIDIGCNDINDDVVASFASSLGSNHKLTLLNIQAPSNPDQLTDTGLMKLSRILCNTSSIMETYSSNHTFQNFYIGNGRIMPTDLKYLLDINRENSKADAARKKIIKAHFARKINMQPFIAMKLELLPHAIAWMGKCRDVTDTDGFGPLYRFIRNLPSFFDFNIGVELDKRSMRKKQKMVS